MTLLPANQPDVLRTHHHLGPARQPDVQGTPHAGAPGEPGKGSVLSPGQLHLPTLMCNIRLLLSRPYLGVALPYDTIVGTILAGVNRNLKRYANIEVSIEA